MGLYDDDFIEEPAKPSNPNLVKSTNNIAVSNKHFAYSNLITHIEGFKWIVTYYSQYLTTDMEPSFLSLGRDGVYQQYLKVNNFEFRVDSPLQPTQDAEGKEFTVTGSGIIYPGFKPNRGDFFIAEVADGRPTIIEITDVEEPGIFKDVTYRVNYRIRNWLDKDHKEDIESKVVSTKVFVKDFFDYGKSPVIEESDYNDWLKINDSIDTLTEFHFDSFYSAEYKNIPIPNQYGTCIDIKFSNYVGDMLHGDYDRYFQNITSNVGDTISDENLWDLLKTTDKKKLLTMSFKNDLLSVSSLHWHPVVNPVRYAGYSSMYVPASVEAEREGVESLSPSEPKVFRRPIDLAELCAKAFEGATYHDKLACDIPPFTLSGNDDFYILSEGFYNEDTENQSLLERLVMDVIDGKSIDTKILLGLVTLIKYQPDLTAYYQVPILIWLLEYKLEDIG